MCTTHTFPICTPLIICGDASSLAIIFIIGIDFLNSALTSSSAPGAAHSDVEAGGAGDGAEERVGSFVGVCVMDLVVGRDVDGGVRGVG